MKVIKESVTLFTNLGELVPEHEKTIGQFIEFCGRECYKSSHKISDESYKAFIKQNAITLGHESMIEHATVSAKIVTNRGVTHELVRHRIAAYSQESTRYCNYSGDRFGNELTFILPVWLEDQSKENETFRTQWYDSMKQIEESYFKLLQMGCTPEQAREVLPNSLASTIVATYNIRQWRHILTQRLSKHCHPQMRNLMVLISSKFLQNLPLFFDDITTLVNLHSIRKQVYSSSPINKQSQDCKKE